MIKKGTQNYVNEIPGNLSLLWVIPNSGLHSYAEFEEVINYRVVFQ